MKARSIETWFQLRSSRGSALHTGWFSLDGARQVRYSQNRRENALLLAWQISGPGRPVNAGNVLPTPAPSWKELKNEIKKRRL